MPAPPPARIKRTQHWATREFHTFLRGRKDTPFAWGTHDCALFAADAIFAFTGVDIASEFRAKYNDQAGSVAIAKQVTGLADPTVADCAAHCAAKHGLKEIPPLMAGRGDLVVLSDAGRVIAGIMHLSGRHVIAQGELGLKKIPVTIIPALVLRAWRV
jgi:hypothetical protein